MMKANTECKAWDDVFPDNHSLEFHVSMEYDLHNIDVDGQATPARHWRSRSGAPKEEEPSTSLDVSPRAFQQLRDGLTRIRKGVDGKTEHKKDDRHITLERDVVHLQMKLQGERASRDVLEKALVHASSSLVSTQNNCAPQKTRDLVREIALLELEVGNLEQHLLSLYRKAFEQQLQSLANNVEAKHLCEPLKIQDGRLQKRAGLKGPHKQKAPANHQIGSSPTSSFSSSLYSHSFIDSKTRQSKTLRSTPKKDKGFSSSYSQPISLLQNATCQSIDSSKLAEISSTFVREEVSVNPNKLSEDLVHCMAAIYCKLAEPSLPHVVGPISPTSSSSASTFSPGEFFSDGWSPICRTDFVCESSSIDLPQGNGATETMEGYKSMVEVPWICVDNGRLTYAAQMLCNFRSLVQQLEKVNPVQMKHEEKLAFWINMYNALMMHAYLAYGIPRNQLKRLTLRQKAAYKIGAYSINAHTIEQSILGCHSHRPAQWLQTILSPMAKFRGDECQAYALDSPEPLVCFALCCGNRSDPAVRVYTPGNIYQELDIAKTDFLQANVSIRKESKVLLPRLLESFSKESSFGLLRLLEWVCGNVPENQQIAIKKCMHWKSHRCVEWVPYNFSFRYIFVRDLAKWPHKELLQFKPV